MARSRSVRWARASEGARPERSPTLPVVRDGGAGRSADVVLAGVRRPVPRPPVLRRSAANRLAARSRRVRALRHRRGGARQGALLPPSPEPPTVGRLLAGSTNRPRRSRRRLVQYGLRCPRSASPVGRRPRRPGRRGRRRLRAREPPNALPAMPQARNGRAGGPASGPPGVAPAASIRLLTVDLSSESSRHYREWCL